MSKELLNLSEYGESNLLPYELLTKEECTYLRELSVYKDKRNNDKNRFHFFEGRDGFQFKADSWVGVLELSNLRIQITPKFDRGFSRLIEMLCFLHETPYHDWRDTSGEYGESDFVELLARMFLSELEKVLRIGIVKEYVAVEENLNQMRGRPDFITNLRLNYAMPTRMYCRYDELLTDVPENQVLRSALEVLLRLPVQADTKKSVRRHLGEFEEICESHIGTEWPEFQYNRLNKHYQTVHRLSDYIVHRTFLKNIYKTREQSYFSLLMDMNELFEQFSAKLLQEFLPKFKYEVQLGAEFRGMFQKGGRNSSWIQPDIVVNNLEENSALVLDVKYKNYGRYNIKNEDAYQLAFYAHSFHHDLRKPCSAHIIYPKYAYESDRQETITLLAPTPHQLALRTKPLSVENCLDLIKTKQEQQLCDIALRLLSDTEQQ